MTKVERMMNYRDMVNDFTSKILIANETRDCINFPFNSYYCGYKFNTKKMTFGKAIIISIVPKKIRYELSQKYNNEIDFMARERDRFYDEYIKLSEELKKEGF